METSNTSDASMAYFHLNRSRMTDYYETDTSRYIQIYAGMPIIVFGTVGNVLSLFVLGRKKMRRIPTSIFLMVLAVVDTVCLYQIVFHAWYFGLTGVYLRNSSLMACRSMRFLLVAGQWSSAWIIVGVSFQRVVAVSVPLKSRVLNTVKSSILGVVGILVVSMGVSSHFFWTFGRAWVEKDNSTLLIECAKIDKHFVYTIWPWIDLVASSLVPFLLLIIFNSIIIYHVRRGKKLHNSHNIIQRPSSSSSSSSSLTAMVLTLSISFLILTLPSHVYFCARPLWYFTKNRRAMEADHLVYTIVSLIKGLNFSSNILLYSFSGTLFRGQLHALFCGGKSRGAMLYDVTNGRQTCSRYGSRSLTSLNTIKEEELRVKLMLNVSAPKRRFWNLFNKSLEAKQNNQYMIKHTGTKTSEHKF